MVDVGVGVAISKKIGYGWGLGCFGLQNCGGVVVVGGIEVELDCG